MTERKTERKKKKIQGKRLRERQGEIQRKKDREITEGKSKR